MIAMPEHQTAVPDLAGWWLVVDGSGAVVAAVLAFWGPVDAKRVASAFCPDELTLRAVCWPEKADRVVRKQIRRAPHINRRWVRGSTSPSRLQPSRKAVPESTQGS